MCLYISTVRGFFVNVYKVENVNVGGQGVRKDQKLVNVVCERPLIREDIWDNVKKAVMEFEFCLGLLSC